MYQIKHIGVSTAGIVDENGIIKYAGSTIPDYINTPIKSELEMLSNLPVSVVNDVDAALLGEVYENELEDKNVYCIALGTGIGGAYYENGLLKSGSHGKANSIGYILYDPSTKTNFEQRASTLSLENKLKPLGISVIGAFEKAKQNDTIYFKIITEWVKEVSKGIAEIIILFDPDYIIIGGGVSGQGNYLSELLKKSVSNFLPPQFCETEIITASQHNDAQLFGAIVPFLYL